MPTPGVAAHYPLERKPAPFQRPIAGKGSDCIGRTAWRKPARGRQDQRWPLLPPFCDEDKELSDHLGGQFAWQFSREL